MSSGISTLSSSVQKEWELAHSNSIKASSSCLSLSEKVKGVFTTARGDVYEGDFINGQMTGQGRWKYANGNTYEGGVIDGKKHGKGIFKSYKKAMSFEGDFLNGKITGKARFTLYNQEVYVGDVVNDKPHGKGKKTWLDGTFYKGAFVQGELTGEGRKIWPDGTSHKGTFVQGVLNGKGQINLPNGISYKGTFVQGILSGKGQVDFPDGESSHGTFDQGVLNGKGQMICSDGTACQGTFKKGFFCSDASNLGDLPFIELLIGSKLHSTRLLSIEYPLGILSDYLIKNNYNELGSSLKSAHSIYYQNRTSDTSSSAAAVWKQLQDKKPQLLLYGSKTHCLGLNIIPNSFSKSVSFEIFNSGQGLPQFHAKHHSKPGKFQTKLTVEIPETELKLEKISAFLQCSRFKTIEEAYEEITKIPRAKVVQPDERSAVWQKSQGDKNCSIEWMFAVLRNKMTKYHYDQMRVGLFSKCILEGKKRKTIGPEIEAELNRKIQKRNKRMRVRNLAGFEKFLKQVEKVHLFC